MARAALGNVLLFVALAPVVACAGAPAAPPPVRRPAVTTPPPGEYRIEDVALVSQTILGVRDAYADPSRIDPRRMVVAATQAAAARFLAEGVIVRTVASGKSAGVTQAVAGDDLSEPMIVLVDSRNAGMSEVVASALQANGRAIVAGERTAGEGHVHVFKDLRARELGQLALRLTAARFHGPDGTSIQDAGVTPDLRLHPVVVTPALVRSGWCGARHDPAAAPELAYAADEPKGAGAERGCVEPIDAADGADRAAAIAAELVARLPARDRAAQLEVVRAFARERGAAEEVRLREARGAGAGASGGSR
jgi:hypothetical protein